MRTHTLRAMVAIAGTLSVLGERPVAQTSGAPSGWDLTIADVDGTSRVLGRLPLSVYAPRVSPDGTRIAYETREQPGGPNGPRLWIAEMADITRRRPLDTVVSAMNWAPMWSPDGQRLVFLASGDRPDAVYWRRADGTGSAEHLVEARSAEGWVAGGAQMRFITLTGDRDYGIAFLDIASKAVTPIIDIPNSAQHSSAISPDGRWLAYASNETGRYEVWLEPLPQTGKRYQLTREGGSHPLWAPDGRSLFFDRDRQMFRLAVNSADPSSASSPVALPVKGFVQAEYRRQFDLLPNGRQFLILVPAIGQ